MAIVFSANNVVNAMSFAGADAGTKINAAIAATNPGGLVYVPPEMPTSYATSIVINKAVNIEGPGRNFYGLRYTGTDWAIKIDNTSTPSLPFISIKNLMLGGNANALGGILIDNVGVGGQVAFGELSNIQIFDFTKVGAWAVRFNASNTNDWLVHNCHIAGNANGIYKTDDLGGAIKMIGGEVADHIGGIGIHIYDTIGAYITNLSLVNNKVNVQLDGAKNFMISGCYSELPTADAASNSIKVTAASGRTSSGIVEGCYLAGGNSPVNAIDLAASSVEALAIIGNRFFNFHGAVVKNAGGTNNGVLLKNELDTCDSLIDVSTNFAQLP